MTSQLPEIIFENPGFLIQSRVFDSVKIYYSFTHCDPPPPSLLENSISGLIRGKKLKVSELFRNHF